MDEFGDRMKIYEGIESDRKCLALLPICARLDGKNFSRFTKGLERPYDQRMSDLMIDTSLYLIKETQANIVYTQSDEISLVWYREHYDSQIFFDRRIQKMTSVLASMATYWFNRQLHLFLPEKVGQMAALFDCRVWQVPTLEEAANTILWRELDAAKNSISMAARHYYSHEQLMNLGRTEQMDLLMQVGVNWNNYPAFFKRGVFIQRQKINRPFTAEEIEMLPPKHEARTNPNLVIERHDYIELDMPPFSKVQNRVGVVIFGELPILSEDQND